jgi:hypothetical protein
MWYDRHQCCPSPLGVHAYELLDPSSETYGTDVFMNHKKLHVLDSLCFVRVCVRQYKDAISHQKIIGNMSRAFSWHFDCSGPGVNVDSIEKFNEYCSSKESKELYSYAYNFHEQVVLDWNQMADSVTISLNMGFAGIPDDSAAGAGSVVLDRN